VLMNTGAFLAALLTKSVSLYAGWHAALVPALGAVDSETPIRARLTVDTPTLSLEHGESLRILVGERLDASALALLRIQHEALLRQARHHGPPIGGCSTCPQPSHATSERRAIAHVAPPFEIVLARHLA